MTESPTILLIRHAETDFAGTFCGQSDPPVNQAGHAQIADLLAKLQSHPIDTVYTSDLQRARTTAEAVANYLKLPLSVMRDLREIAFGDWENKTWAMIEETDMEYAQRWMAEFPNLPAPHGEEYATFERRALNAFDAVCASAENAAVVTHGGVLRVILTRRCGLSNEQAWVQTKAYCGIHTYSLGKTQSQR